MKDESAWQPAEIRIDPSRPLYEQFVEMIRSDIARGVLKPGMRLPSVRDLASHLRVNPNTVMRTYQDLERERLIVTYRGQGTFVTESENVILQSKRMIAKTAYAQLEQVAASIGLTVDDLLTLAKSEKAEKSGVNPQ